MPHVYIPRCENLLCWRSLSIHFITISEFKLQKRSYPNVLKSRLSKGNKIQAAQRYQIEFIQKYQVKVTLRYQIVFTQGTKFTRGMKSRLPKVTESTVTQRYHIKITQSYQHRCKLSISIQHFI